MRIAITADPEIPVPPQFYGGIERIIDLHVRGLVALGHSVTVFAHPDSQLPCELVPYPGLKSGAIPDLVKNSRRIASRARDFDIIHSFGRLAYLVPVLSRKIPKLMSYQRHVTRRNVVWGARLSQGSLAFTACSGTMLSGMSGAGNWHVVHNAVPIDRYLFRDQVAADAPLVFLGRVEPIKGPHIAIEIAKRSGRDLVIAGNVPAEHQLYFEEKIRPHVGRDGVSYAGAVNDAQKNELLGRAAALLMPIQWEEPFGIVMPEALACGTPVIGFRRGAVPEIVEDGVNGLVCDDVDAMIDAVSRASRLDRRACRRSAEDRFSGAVMTEAYLRVYRALLSQLQ